VESLLNSVTKTEAAYQNLRWNILTGSLAPGLGMNQETLARELGVSPTPVREALRRLESEGLVRFAAHSTVNVAPLSLRELDELYQVRSVLDPLAARLTAAVASDEELHAIGATLHAETGDVSDERLFEHNRAFHRAVYAGCGNSELVAVLDHLWDRTERYRYILVTTRVDESASGHDHQEIADALRRRDLRHVSRLLAAHVKRSHDLTRATLERAERSTVGQGDGREDGYRLDRDRHGPSGR
jgi:DNA-binding GntR family transcriptional regulator